MNPDRWISLCCDYFLIRRYWLLYGRDKLKWRNRARQVCMKLLYKHEEMTYKEIGAMFDNRDHSTVIHACNIAEESHQRHIQEIENREKAARQGRLI